MLANMCECIWKLEVTHVTFMDCFPPLFFETESLTDLIVLGWLDKDSPCNLVLKLQECICPALYVGPGLPNSDTNSCVIRSLPTESSLKYLIFSSPFYLCVQCVRIILSTLPSLIPLILPNQSPLTFMSSFCACICASGKQRAIPHAEDSISQSFSPSLTFYVLYTHTLQCSLVLGRRDTDITFKVKHSTTMKDQHFSQLSVSASDHYKKAHLESPGHYRYIGMDFFLYSSCF